MRRLRLWFAVLLAILMVGDVKADIVPLPARGAGLGNINAILIIGNNLTEESGCVSWNGSADIIGPAACPPGIPGGDERAAPLATKTVPIADLGVANAQSLRIVFNANESGGDSIRLEQLVLTIYGATTGAVLFQGGIVSPIDYPTTDPGIGQLEGPLLQLDALQAAAAQAALRQYGESHRPRGASVSDVRRLRELLHHQRDSCADDVDLAADDAGSPAGRRWVDGVASASAGHATDAGPVEPWCFRAPSAIVPGTANDAPVACRSSITPVPCATESRPRSGAAVRGPARSARYGRSYGRCP